MAVPVLETHAVNGTTDLSGGLPCTKPSGVVAGDLLIILAGTDQATSNPVFSNNLTGWNFIDELGADPPQAQAGAFWREATGSESATETITVGESPTSSDEGFSFYLRISGADVTTPIHQQNFSNLHIFSVSSHDILGVTTTIDDCLCLYFLSFDGADGDPYSVSGTGWSEAAETTADYGFATAGSGGCFGQRDLASQGASGTATVTSSQTDGAVHFQLAIAPGASDTTAPVLSLPTAAATSATRASGTVTTDEDNGTLYYYASTNSSELAATIVASGSSQAVSATGVQNVSDIGIVPATETYLHYVHDDDATNRSNVVSSTSITSTALPGSVTYDGLTIPDTSMLYFETFTHDGANNAAILTDSTLTLTIDARIGFESVNETDSSLATITDNDATTVTGTLSGGTDNDYDIGDTGFLQIAIDNPDIIYYATSSTVSSEQYSFDYYIYDNSDNSFSVVATVTIDATGAPDGSGTVSLDASGIPTFTYSTGGEGMLTSLNSSLNSNLNTDLAG